MTRSWDESDVKIRPSKRSRPRTKDRPKHDDAKFGMVITKDRGRWGVVLDDQSAQDNPIVCMRARELGRTPIEVGDRVGIVGDTSGRKDTLARIVKLAERKSVLRRTADDTDPYERIVVANAEQLLIVCAVANRVCGTRPGCCVCGKPATDYLFNQIRLGGSHPICHRV